MQRLLLSRVAILICLAALAPWSSGDRRQPVLRLLERGGADLELLVLGQALGDALVHALGIDLPDRLVLLLVDVLAPDGDADHLRFLPKGRRPVRPAPRESSDPARGVKTNNPSVFSLDKVLLLGYSI